MILTAVFRYTPCSSDGRKWSAPSQLCPMLYASTHGYPSDLV